MRDSAAAAKVLLEFSASLTALCNPPQADEISSEGKCVGVQTALHLAAHHDSVEVLMLLLEAKANVAACVKGVPGALTPLHECAVTDAARSARLLAPWAAEAARRGEAELERALGGEMEVDQGAGWLRKACRKFSGVASWTHCKRRWGTTAALPCIWQRRMTQPASQL
ncbi:unnamed protein product [Effrenium voratum]|nr:unnamed protein product [Effrenium voratum]